MLQNLISDLKKLQDDDFVFITFDDRNGTVLEFRCYPGEIHFGEIVDDNTVNGCKITTATTCIFGLDFEFNEKMIFDKPNNGIENCYMLTSSSGVLVIVF